MLIVIYKGWKFFNLGMDRWKVKSPNKNFTFNIIFKDGLKELIQRVNLWMEVIDDTY